MGIVIAAVQAVIVVRVIRAVHHRTVAHRAAVIHHPLAVIVHLLHEAPPRHHPLEAVAVADVVDVDKMNRT